MTGFLLNAIFLMVFSKKIYKKNQVAATLAATSATISATTLTATFAAIPAAFLAAFSAALAAVFSVDVFNDDVADRKAVYDMVFTIFYIAAIAAIFIEYIV